MLGIKKESQKKTLRISINDITLTENMNILYMKTEKGFMNIVGNGTFFTLRKNGSETNYCFSDNAVFIFEGGIK